MCPPAAKCAWRLRRLVDDEIPSWARACAPSSATTGNPTPRKKLLAQPHQGFLAFK
jgi:hypothetical protein